MPYLRIKKKFQQGIRNPYMLIREQFERYSFQYPKVWTLKSPFKVCRNPKRRICFKTLDGAFPNEPGNLILHPLCGNAQIQSRKSSNSTACSSRSHNVFWAKLSKEIGWNNIGSMCFFLIPDIVVSIPFFLFSLKCSN